MHDIKKTIDVLCMGRAAVDLYSEQYDCPLSEVQTFKKYVGGCPANISIGCARLGLTSSLYSCVGKDAMGDFILNELTAEGVDTQCVANSPDHLTGLVLLGISPPSHFPLIFYRENCADMQLTTEAVHEEKIKSAKYLLISGTGISTDKMRVATRLAIQIAKNAATKIIFDLDYRPVLWGVTAKGDGESRFVYSDSVSKTYREFIGHCDYLIGTEEELAIASGNDDTHDLLNTLQLLRRNTKAHIVCKLGLQGSMLVTPTGEKISEPTYPVTVLNTLGAGDAYCSGFIYSLTQGHDISDCLSFANACGALVCMRHGCAPAMPTKQEVYEFLQVAKESSIKKTNAVKTSAKIENLAEYRRVPMVKKQLAILAFDHRLPFVESLHSNQSTEKISQFKSLIYRAVQDTLKKYSGRMQLGLLCDDDYGQDSLTSANFIKHLLVCSPIENPGSYPVSWSNNSNIIEQIKKRPVNQIVKVLARLPRSFSATEDNYQLAQLKQLYAACRSYDRKLMIELVPEENDQVRVTQALCDCYQAEIFPEIWKLPQISSKNYIQSLDAIVEEFDKHAGYIALGGAELINDASFSALDLFKKGKYAQGFAFGRCLFWREWQQFISGDITDEIAIEQISANYQSAIAAWEVDNV